MKIITTLTILLVTLGLNAQDYFSNNPQWRQSSSCRWWGDCIEEQEYVYYINGDSVVNNLTYKKLFKHGVLDQNWIGPPPSDGCGEKYAFNSFKTLLRQDGTKIYIKEPGEIEALLYNFDLKVGDTLPLTWNQWHEDIVVKSIDSLLVGNSYKKIFNLTQQSSPQLIEGIGHAFGFIEPFPPILECGHFLKCFALNDTTYYPNYSDPCDLSVKIKPNLQKNIRYYPNPVINDLILDYDNSKNIEQIVSYNALGQKEVLMFKTGGEHKISVDLSGLVKGLHIIQILEKGETTLNLKVIKNQ